MAATTYRGAIPLFKDRSLLAGEPTGPLRNGEGTFYLDFSTPATPKIMCKFKDLSGVIKKQQVTSTAA
jgi:hypothetical protein